MFATFSQPLGRIDHDRVAVLVVHRVAGGNHAPIAGGCLALLGYLDHHRDGVAHIHRRFDIELGVYKRKAGAVDTAAANDESLGVGEGHHSGAEATLVTMVAAELLVEEQRLEDSDQRDEVDEIGLGNRSGVGAKREPGSHFFPGPPVDQQRKMVDGGVVGHRRII